MTPAPTVFVVTPVHNRRHYTEPFLDCLSRQTYSPLRVIIFDDGSTDGTSEVIKARFPNTILLHGDGNVWWTASVNRAISRALQDAADTDYILVMNDDVEIGDDFVARLVDFTRRHPRALVNAVTVDVRDPTLIEFGGVRINWWTAKSNYVNRGRRLTEFPTGHAERSSYLNGRAALIPVPVFRTIGLYDERRFLNCGDTELPVRAAKRGWDLYVTYDAPVHSHIDALADKVNRGEEYALSQIGTYFFSVKSYARLSYRFFFAVAGAGPNPLRILVYFAMDVVRITGHFVRGLR